MKVPERRHKHDCPFCGITFDCDEASHVLHEKGEGVSKPHYPRGRFALDEACKRYLEEGQGLQGLIGGDAALLCQIVGRYEGGRCAVDVLALALVRELRAHEKRVGRPMTRLFREHWRVKVVKEYLKERGQGTGWYLAAKRAMKTSPGMFKSGRDLRTAASRLREKERRSGV
jgi:hypothetical protein